MTTMTDIEKDKRLEVVLGKLTATVDMMKEDMDMMLSDIRCIFKRLEHISADIAVLKYKASVWGVVGGILAAVGVMLISLLK